MKLDKILASAPIDASAKRVTAQSKEVYVPNKKIVQNHWECNPGCHNPTKNDKRLVGTKFGEFTVLGVYGKNSGKKTIWLTRCSCGHFETRTSKAILNPNNNWDCCDLCRHQLFLKRDSKRKSTGKSL